MQTYEGYCYENLNDLVKLHPQKLAKIIPEHCRKHRECTVVYICLLILSLRVIWQH